ncbi:MAG TPA: bifunctional diaminohydroxyphosphoribosylaminopyrimidine deaminase/5-amino-6-(5-phosphoribosylamino)uracil reductase RibD [Chitinophagales bacterium]|nr:bifunctional diaminohydroxyphosphoribosylaminopyrimidine deaminase/5-amino-6-(5-phosphoribosylamino)uracil reductase RibD [Chitinophagales bacterium]
MEEREPFMKRCIELAQQGAGNVAPNPMVGCVIVYEGKIIGEGFHEKFGEPHAEVNAIKSVSNGALLPYSTLYVNLEPCSHFGKTPPCADLIVEKKIPEVIIGCLDPNPLVAGEGVKKLQGAGCRLQVGVLGNESKGLNKRFITFHEKKRPYIILKWAQTRDGFIAPGDKSRVNISNEFSRTLAHRWRSEEAAIMIGRNTAMYDNPKLSASLWNNHRPWRIVLDRKLRLPTGLNLFDHTSPTIVFTEKEKPPVMNLDFIRVGFENDLLKNILVVLYKKQIQSILVEGGAQLLQSFLNEGLWDEMRIFIAPSFLTVGVPAPKMSGNKISEEDICGDQLIIFENKL